MKKQTIIKKINEYRTLYSTYENLRDDIKEEAKKDKSISSDELSKSIDEYKIIGYVKYNKLVVEKLRLLFKVSKKCDKLFKEWYNAIRTQIGDEDVIHEITNALCYVANKNSLEEGLEMLQDYL